VLFTLLEKDLVARLEAKCKAINVPSLSIAWSALRARQLGEEANIGALMEHLDRGVLDLLSGAQITLSLIG
jgi:hypothetical protein